MGQIHIKTPPVQVQGLTGVTAIAGGCNHTIAIKNDGTVYTWGYNFNGQLGDGTNTYKNTPVQVQGLSDVTAIAGGGGHTIAIKSNGTVWAWGYNLAGQLGDGTRIQRNIPIQVLNLSDVTAIAGGAYHTIAIGIGIQDTTPPMVACFANPNVLWPPDHKLVPIFITVDVTDEGSGANGFTLLSVISSESDDDYGDGRTTGDIQGADSGTPDTELLLRAERSGNGAGRIYTLTYEGFDFAGNSAICDVIVTVPHGRR